MEDSTWDFFCNNSPRLVVKNRTKTPTISNDRFSALEIPKLIPNTLIKSRLFKQPSNLINNSQRTIYRDLTPSTPNLIKNSSRIMLKPGNLLKPSIMMDLSKKNVSPLRNIKQILPLTKKTSLKGIKKNK